MDARIETEYERAAAVEQQIRSLIEHARALILEQFASLSAAIENADTLVAEAHTMARQFNLEEGCPPCDSSAHDPVSSDLQIVLDHWQNAPAVLARRAVR